MNKNNYVMKKICLMLLSMMVVFNFVACGNANKKEEVVETTETKKEVVKIDSNEKNTIKKVMRATKSAPDKDPNLDKVKITGTLEGSANKTIQSQAEISSNNKDLTIKVDKNLISGLTVGDTTMVNTPNGQYQATITSIPKIPQNGIYSVSATFPSPIPKVSNVIVPCSYTYKKKRTKYVPRSVVYYEDSRPYVYIVDYDDRVRKEYIELGIMSNTYFEVIEGLLFDSFILTDWNENIEIGEEVIYTVDTNDFIDDDYIITKTSDSMTISDGDTEITFYDDGSFGGGGNFSDDYYYEQMIEQYNEDTGTYVDSTDAVEGNNLDVDTNETEYSYTDHESDADYGKEEYVEDHVEENIEYSDDYHYEDNMVEDYSEDEHNGISEDDNYNADTNYEDYHNDDNYDIEAQQEEYTTTIDEGYDPHLDYDDSVGNDDEEAE